MSNDLRSFSKRMRQHGKDVETNATLLARNTAIQISKVLTTDATPVKSGQARNNWIASVGMVVNRVVAGSSFDKSGRERHAENEKMLSSSKPGQTLYIQNGLPYIRRLNDGWSKQAPAGFVEAAVQLANNVLRRARLIGVSATVKYDD